MQSRIIWVIAGSLLWAGVASASEFVPLVPKIEPPAAAERVNQFHNALAQGLKAGGATVVPAGTVRSKLKAPEEAGCDEGPCVQSNSALLGSDRIATARVSSVGKNYTLEVRLFHGTVLTAKLTGRCDICTNAEAVKTLQRLAAEAGAKGEQLPAVAPQPGPKVAPQPLPPSPPAPAPAPKVEPRPMLDQPPGPSAVPSQTARPRQQTQNWQLWTAIIAGGVGVLGIVVGAPLVAIDGNGTNCRGTPLPNKSNCQDLYATAGIGWTLTGIGIGGLVTSGVFFGLYFSSKPKERSATATVPRFSVAPLPEGGMVFGASGRF